MATTTTPIENQVVAGYQTVSVGVWITVAILALTLIVVVVALVVSRKSAPRRNDAGLLALSEPSVSTAAVVGPL